MIGEVRGGRILAGIAIAIFMVTARIFAQTDPGPVDISDRETARQWFNTWWPKTYGAPMNFTGDADHGVPGSVSQAYQDQALLRLNIYRRLAGEQPVVLNDSYNAEAAAAAVLCAVNDDLSHTPPTTWKYYTAEGAKGCSESLLGGAAGSMGVRALIYDGEEKNAAAAHRFGLLNPAVTAFGFGSAPPSRGATALLDGVLAIYDNDPSTLLGPVNYNRPLVLWPNAGYIPYYLFPPRWSVTIPDASRGDTLDLSKADVQVEEDGTPLEVGSLAVTPLNGGAGLTFPVIDIESPQPILGPSTIAGEVFYSLAQGRREVTFHVTISGIIIRATGQPYNGSGIFDYYVHGYDPTIAFELGQPPASLVNISTRSFAGSGSSTQIAGFIIGGTGSRTVLIRAGGPYLNQFGVGQTLSDPVLTLFDGQTKIGLNDNWEADADSVLAFAKIAGAVPFLAGSKDAAMVATLEPGHAYTVQVVGFGQTTGNAIVEVYDVTSPGTSNLVNISTRSYVGTGASIQIGGFIMRGAGPRKILVRAGGPYLNQFGVRNVLADPVLRVFSGNLQIFENDDWGSDSAMITAATTAVGAQPFIQGSSDAACVLTLQPGIAYTAQVSGKNGTTGNAIVEIYAIP